MSHFEISGIVIKDSQQLNIVPKSLTFLTSQLDIGDKSANLSEKVNKLSKVITSPIFHLDKGDISLIVYIEQKSQ